MTVTLSQSPMGNFNHQKQNLIDTGVVIDLFNHQKSWAHMSYRIEEIEGIGSAYAVKLNNAGINTTDDLLNRASTKAGKESLAAETGITEKLILKWANHADLMRIKGIGGQFAELLEASGVDTVKELRHRVASNLHTRIVEVNEAKNLCNRTPAETEVKRMIDQAKELPPIITY